MFWEIMVAQFIIMMYHFFAAYGNFSACNEFEFYSPKRSFQSFKTSGG